MTTKAQDLGPLEPLVEAIAQRVAEQVADLVVERLATSSAPRLLTKQQLAVALSVSLATIDRYIRRGLFVPSVRLGGPDGPQRFELAKVRAALECASATSTATAPRRPDAAPRLLKRGSR